jgi:hypothetical protein
MSHLPGVAGLSAWVTIINAVGKGYGGGHVIPGSIHGTEWAELFHSSARQHSALLASGMKLLQS